VDVRIPGIKFVREPLVSVRLYLRNVTIENAWPYHQISFNIAKFAGTRQIY
jgi:hypothetical protein